MSSLTHAIGSIFQPILKFIAEIMAFFFALIPSYPVAVALLTIVVMAALTPLTVKSTKNMAAMQRLGPEMKKLQAKYKGPENRALLNEEMMKLYKEHNVNPASGCLPMLLQMPFFFMLYSVIRGITNTVSKGATLPYTYVNGVIDPNTSSKCTQKVCADPRYLSETSKMYHDIVAAHGQLISGGIDFAAKLLSHHASPWAYIPYAVLVAGAVGLQYLQMARLNARNPQANQANPQAAMLQKYMPLIFGFIYLNVAAILNVYLSSRAPSGSPRRKCCSGRASWPVPIPRVPPRRRATPGPVRSPRRRTAGSRPRRRPCRSPRAAAPGRRRARTRRPPTGRPRAPMGADQHRKTPRTDGGGQKKPHPRSKAKKERKAC